MHQCQKHLQRAISLFMTLLLIGALCFTSLPFAIATESTERDRIIEPTLPNDVDPYDAEKPEELQEEQLYAKSAILIEASSGEVIFEKNPDELMYPASTTKIMTALLGIMMGDMSQQVTLTDSAANIPDDSSTIGLEIGETINFEDLLYATMVRSGNEGANLIAETISGDNATFVELMNQAAALYGCTSTHFVNPSGLDDENQYSTARDMAKIAQAAMQNETFRKIAKTYNYSLPRSNLHRSRVLISGSDSFLNPNIEDNEFYYRYATGIKTGSTSKAGYCFVGSAEREGVELISVVFYSSRRGRWRDTKKLMEYGFSQFISITPEELYQENPLTIETSGFSLTDTDLGRLELGIQATEGTRTVKIVATKAEVELMIKNMSKTILVEYKRDFAAPIQQGEVMGIMTYYPPDGGSAVVYNLVAERSILRRENAPKSIEEIEAEVYADPNPFPDFSLELLLLIVAPIVGIVVVIKVMRRLLNKTGRKSKIKTPKPRNRYYR